ncbi:MAG: transglutaminase domain-containing protein [Sarcina sp.]
MRKLLVVCVILAILIISAAPFSILFSNYGRKQNNIIAGDSWQEANFGSVTAYSGNIKNTSQYSGNVGIVDGQPANEVTVGNNAMKAKANQITALATSNYQKAQEIYVWIAENIKYDSKSYGVKDPAIYAFEHRKAVCTGFAGLYSAMCRDVGLSVRQLGGLANGKPHTWNQVYVDKQWINVDCTFASSLFEATSSSGVTLTKEEAYIGLTVYKPLVITRGMTTITFGISDYFNSLNFMKNRKAKYLLYQYNAKS